MGKSNKSLVSRQYVVIGIFSVVGLIYLLRLFSLQVLDSELKQSADNNVLRYVVQYPARGKVFDRNGKLLVYNEAVYDLMVIPNEVRAMDTAEFCRLVNISQESFSERLSKARNYSRIKASVFVGQISKEDYAHIAEVLFRFPGFYFQTRTLRHYPNAIAAHTLGDIGGVSKEDMKADPYYNMSDYIGKSGLERVYEKELRGKKGLKVMLVDVHNREKGSYRDGALDTLPVPGKDLYLGLDIDLQTYGEQLMHGKIGSIVAIEPKTGQILAFVNSPTYDPNLLVGRVRKENYSKLVQGFGEPLLNRAASGCYPPGSTFKTVNGMIALQTGSIVPSTRFHCNGKASTPIKCTHFHDNAPDLANAIENSCNPYFYEAFKATITNPKYGNTKKGLANWQQMAFGLGLGHCFGTDIPAEKPGRIPGPQYYDAYFSKWNHLTIKSLGIGQGEIAVTPLQLANVAAVIANEGYYYPPHFLVAYGDSTAIPEKMTTRVETGIEQKNCRIIKEDMRLVFEGPHGTARMCKIPGIAAGGKTGTAQNSGPHHSLFIAFAPFDDPQIAIAVIVENGGYGATWAAPIATLMIEKYLKGYTDRPAMEDRMMKGVVDYSKRKKK